MCQDWRLCHYIPWNVCSVCVCLIHIAKLRASICFKLKFTDTWDFLRTPRQIRRQVHLSNIHPANLLSGATRSSVRVRWGCDWWRGAEESGPEEPKIMWERCQSIVSSRASRSLLTKQTDVTCVLNIPLQCHKVFKLPQFKDDDQAQECLEFGFKAEGCLLFRVWAVANFRLSGTVNFQIPHKKCVYRLQPNVTSNNLWGGSKLS